MTGSEMFQTSYSEDVRDAAKELMRLLENLEVHHGRPRWHSKESVHMFMKGVYDLAAALATPKSQ